jgi:hypothetical protein
VTFIHHPASTSVFAAEMVLQSGVVGPSHLSR